jgi:uncharacterized protein YukE
MPYLTVEVQRLVRFIPEAARDMEAELRAVAGEVREVAERLRVLQGQLETEWEGAAQARFIQDFSGLPAACESEASQLEGEARELGSLTLERWETVSERQWVPD